MKNAIYIIGVIFLFIVACDKIEPFDDGTYISTPLIEEGGDTIPHVILFEFTGWNCPNCPSGHEMVHELEKVYHESVKAIAIHAGFFAVPGNDNYYDFRTAVGNEFYEQFNKPNTFPIGAINSMNSLDFSASVDQWPTDFSEAYNTSNTNTEAFLTYTYSHNNNTLQADVKIDFNANLQGTYNLSVLVVENGIEDIQNNEGDIDDYIHNHVLRASMNNGIVGDIISSDPKVGTEFEKSFTLNIDSEWVADSLHVIPFIYNVENNIVIPTKVIKPKTE